MPLSLSFRFSIVAPDGSRFLPLELLIPVPPPPPLIRFTRVSPQPGNAAFWDSDGFFVSDGQPASDLKINGQSPIETFSIGGGEVGCIYDFQPIVGDVWTLDQQPEHIIHDAPFAIPQSGFCT